MGVSSTSTTPLGAASIVGNGGGTMGAVERSPSSTGGVLPAATVGSFIICKRTLAMVSPLNSTSFY